MTRSVAWFAPHRLCIQRRRDWIIPRRAPLELDAEGNLPGPMGFLYLRSREEGFLEVINVECGLVTIDS